MFIFLPKIIPNVKFAPSKLAAKYTFGKKCIENNKAMLLNNGLNTKQFTYSVNKRCKIRNQLGIEEDKTVIGHIGRFNTQKNHEFLIDIFNEVHKQKENSILLLAGQGPLMDEMKNKVRNLKLEGCVKFLGQRNDVNELYQAFDVFCLPSLYEGLPVVGIEAQATGLLCVFSDDMTKETKILDSTIFLSLEQSNRKWADYVLNDFKTYKRKDVKNEIIDSGFDIIKESKLLEKTYENMSK